MNRNIGLLLFAVLFYSRIGMTALEPEQVPEPLRPWADWVLLDDKQYQCPFVYNDFAQKRCAWPSRLKLDLQADKGLFDISWQVYAESWVALPGGKKFWPQQVTVNNLTATVIERQGHPVIKLTPGNYTIRGQFNWDYIPDNLAIPGDSGLVSLSIKDQVVELPDIKKGQLWLKPGANRKTSQKSAQNRLDIQVFRRIIDDVPLQVLTRMNLDVSGSQRQIKLPTPLLPGFIPMRVQSQLPAKIENDGSLLMQLRPGRWQIEILARHGNELEQLSLPAKPAIWPNNEIWVFEAKPYQRLVEIDKLSAIDPSQTNLPKQWHHLPAYLIQQGETMGFKVIRRGDPEPEPNQLSLKRRLWLDFDGRAYTINDQINGTMTRGWRLNTLPELQLGKASLDGRNQPITKLPDTDQQGIEVRKGRLNVSADSRFQGSINSMSAVGWQQTFHQVSAELNLPPGWRLLAAQGVDNIPDTWVYRWTLFDLFVVLITALAIARLWNNYWGLFALITLVLIWHEPDSPHFIWLNILAATALLKVLPSNNFRRFMLWYRNAFCLGLLVIAIPFMVNQVRTGLYPQLEKPWQTIAPDPSTRAQAKSLDDQMNSAPMIAGAEMSKSMAEFKRPSRLKSRATKVMPVQKQGIFDRIDPDANVPTGPGLPQWQWHKINMSWNGSVAADQKIRFWYLSPTMSMLLHFIRVFLIAVLALLMFGVIKQNMQWQKPSLTGTSLLLALIVLPLTLLTSQSAYADFPNQELLKTLKQKLLQPPQCLPNCGQITAMQLSIDDRQLKINLEIHADKNLALPLPSQYGQWFPNQVKVNKGEASALFRSDQGILWLEVEKGVHQVRMIGQVPALNKFTLPLPLKPGRIHVQKNGWRVEGVNEHGRTDRQLQFTRIVDRKQTAVELTALELGELPAFVHVERTLMLGLDWRVRTRINRVTPTGSSIVLAVPLLAGESVTTPDIKVNENKVLVNMSADQRSWSWDSSLTKTAEIKLTAAITEQWTEIWRADISPIWHVQTTTGISVVHHQNKRNRWLPEWRPWPGESVILFITRPKAVQGQTLTLEKTHLRLKPGKRAMDAALSLNFNSSSGRQHTIELPRQAQLLSVTIDGVNQPIRQKQQQVTIPIKPGKQQIDLNWRQDQGLKTNISSPVIKPGLASINNHINIQLGSDRWVLFTIGPKVGPAVLIWGMLMVMALVSLGLGKITVTPLKHWQWFLLLLGLSQIPIIAGILVVAWLMILGIRKQQPLENVRLFNFVQFAIGGLTVIALGLLFFAIQQGLLGSPEMQISGNQSTAFNLNWYQDRSTGILPIAQVVSLPIFVYRLLMLAWSLWLALALLSWLKWGWSCFSAGGLWKKKPLVIKQGEVVVDKIKD